MLLGGKKVDSVTYLMILEIKDGIKDDTRVVDSRDG